MARRGVSYVSAAQLVSMSRDPRVAIVDVRDEERSYDGHIAGSHHYASDSFADRMPELAQATGAKETLVFHCALSKVKVPVSPFLCAPTCNKLRKIGISKCFVPCNRSLPPSLVPPCAYHLYT